MILTVPNAVLRTCVGWGPVMALAILIWGHTPAAAAALLGDLDGDGQITVLDLTRLQNHLNGANPLQKLLQLQGDIDQDGLISDRDVSGIADIIMGLRLPQELPPPTILSTSPSFGEGNVSLNRETIIRFTQPLAPTNIVTADTLYAIFGGRRILSRVELASDLRSVSLFYLEPLPASARMRVLIDGDSLSGLLGMKVDVDGDGVPGGLSYLEFDTASISPVPGTAIIGTVFTSELVPDPSNLTNSVNVPLAGVTITVDGAEQTLRTVTDTNGNFTLSPCPAGRFFVHVDGRTVTNLAESIRYPDLAYYPFVGKAWEAVAGYTNNLAGGNGLIFLPLVRQGTLQPVSLVNETLITFPPSVVADNPALEGVSMSVPAGALYNDNGERGGRMGMAPVPPDRLPEPLPPGLDFPLVITVQTDGALNLSEPAPVCFPNLPDPNTGELLPPGAKTALWSFNHDVGRWEIQGSMTVTADGQYACSDPGVGIRQPGWHGIFPGTSGEGGENDGDRSNEPTPLDKGETPPGSPGGEACSEDRLADFPPVPGDPVHLFSGEFYHSEEDMRIKGVGPDFVWARRFQSLRVDASAPMLPFGPRWTHSYAIRLQFNHVPSCVGACGGLDATATATPAASGSSHLSFLCTTVANGLTSVSVIDGNGRRDEYFNGGDGVFRAKGLFRELRYEDPDTWSLVFEDKGKWIFSRAVGYQISRIEDRNGNSLDFIYESFDTTSQPQYRLAAIRDTLGRLITISYTPDNQISAVTDFTGRSVKYEYYPMSDPNGFDGLLKAVISPVVTDTVTGNDFRQGKRRTYTYFIGPKYRAGWVQLACDLRFNQLESFIGIATISDGRNNDPGDSRYQLGPYLRNYYSASGFSARSKFLRSPNVDFPQWIEVPYLRMVRQTWGGQDMYFTYEQFGVPATFDGKPVLATSGDLYVTTRDRNSNVKRYRYDQYNQIRMFNEYTGRPPATGPVWARTNRPTARLRSGDPADFGTRYSYNSQFQHALVERPNGNATQYFYQQGGGRSAGNLLAITNLPGAHMPAGDQTRLVRQFRYDTEFNPCCGFNFATNVIDARGYSVHNAYDTRGNLMNRVLQIPSIQHDYSYNECGQLTEHVHPGNGGGHRRVDRFEYYESGPQRGYLRHAIVDATGFALTNTFEHDARGNVTRWIDPKGHDTLYVVNQLDQVIREVSRDVTDGSGIRYQRDFYYDANDNVVLLDVQNLDENGAMLPNTHFTTTYEYDLLDYLTRKTEEVEQGRVIATEYAYDGNRNLTEVRKGEATAGRQPGNVIRYVYDERDLLFREIRAPGTPQQSTTQYDYDGNRNLVRVLEGLEETPHVTELTYDGYDRLVAVHDPIGNETLLSYDANGNTIRRRVNGELVDLPGAQDNDRLTDIRYEYDPMNRLVREDKEFFDTKAQTPIGTGLATTRVEYSGTSQIIRIVNANGHTNSIAYDTANRRRTFTDAAGNTITLDYDRNSNVATVSEVEKPDLDGPDERFTTRFLYDNLDRLTATIDNVNTTNRFGYDSRNNRTLHVNGRGNVVRYTYDGLSRRLDTIREMTDTGDGTGTVVDTIVTREDWDDSSRLIGQADDNGNTTAYTYDPLDRKIATTYADGTVHSAALDVHGNPVLTLDANGTYVTNRFDDLDRLVRRDVAVGPGVSDDTTFENYRYDGRSRLVWAEDDDSTVQLEYDSLSKVLRDIQNGTVVGSAYDAMGNMTKLFYPGGRIVTNTYDLRERLKTVSDVDGVIARYDYAGPWRVKQRDYGNGTRLTYEYDGGAGIGKEIRPPTTNCMREVIHILTPMTPWIA
jgi:YD repeat-containing protein